MYLAELPGRIEAIVEAVEQGDFETVKAAAHSLPLRNCDRLNTVPSSVRALNTLKTWNSTKVVKAMARACSSLPTERWWARTPSVPTAITEPARATWRSRRALRMRAPGRRGASSMARPLGGSTPSAMAGGPSMIRFTQRTWMAVKGTGSPVTDAPMSVRMAPTLVDSWKRTKVTMLR